MFHGLASMTPALPTRGLETPQPCPIPGVDAYEAAGGRRDSPARFRDDVNTTKLRLAISCPTDVRRLLEHIDIGIPFHPDESSEPRNPPTRGTHDTYSIESSGSDIESDSSDGRGLPEDSFCKHATR